MAGMWINENGDSVSVNNPQDVAAALANDPEMQVVVEETIVQEVEDKK